MEHGTRDCMSNVQCFRCKKMGHRSAVSCVSQPLHSVLLNNHLYQSCVCVSQDCKNASSSECFRCGSLLHNHDVCYNVLSCCKKPRLTFHDIQDCPSIWRIYKVTVKKNPNDIWCCHCAARGHSYLVRAYSYLGKG
jgi:hypothetical protein